MIIIDEGAEGRLLAIVSKPRDELLGMRCLLIHLKDIDSRDERAKLVIRLTANIPDPEATAYVCQDGEVYVLGHDLGYKLVEPLGRLLAHIRGVENAEGHIELFDLAQQTQRILPDVNAKLEKLGQTRKMVKIETSRELQERRRHDILFGEIDPMLVSSIATRRATHERPEVLMIEDDAFSRKLVENSLRDSCNVLSLGNATEARMSYVLRAPNMVLLDINLPDVTGHELLKCFIEMDPAAYVVMLSGNGNVQNVRHALDIGAKGFIGKPFTRDKLLQYVKRCPTLNASHGATT